MSRKRKTMKDSNVVSLRTARANRNRELTREAMSNEVRITELERKVDILTQAVHDLTVDIGEILGALKEVKQARARKARKSK